jgi:hypothetical protein
VNPEVIAVSTTTDHDRVEALVPRVSDEETTYAVVRCAAGPRVSSAADLHRRIAAAVTAWVRRSAAGREAYRRSGGDYNVGDLAGDLGDPDLGRLLRAHGVRDLTIDTFSAADAPAGWTYDTHLVDAAGPDAPAGDAGADHPT